MELDASKATREHSSQIPSDPQCPRDASSTRFGMNWSAGAPHRSCPSASIFASRDAIRDGEHFIRRRRRVFLEQRRHRSNRGNGDVRVRQSRAYSRQSRQSHDGIAEPVRRTNHETRRRSHVFIFSVCRVRFTQCSWGPTPQSLSLGASRLARAVRPVAFAFPFAFSLFPFYCVLSSTSSAVSPVSGDADGNIPFTCSPAGTSRQRRCIHSHSSG